MVQETAFLVLYHFFYKLKSSSLSLRNMEEHKFSGVNLDLCLRNKYEAVLKALSDATEVAGLTR